MGRTHQTVHQPLVHETRTHTVQEVSQAFATPLAQNVGVPVSVEQTHVAHGVAHVPTPFPLPDTPWSDTLPSDTPDTLASPLLPDTPDTPDTLWPLPHTKLVQPIPCTLQSELYHECSDRLRHTLQEGGGQWWLFFVVASVLR